MNFETIVVYREERFSLERDPKTGKYYVEFPVYSGAADYSEYYFISDREFKEFSENFELLKAFVQECRERKRDERLLMKPGTLRGFP